MENTKSEWIGKISVVLIAYQASGCSSCHGGKKRTPLPKCWKQAGCLSLRDVQTVCVCAHVRVRTHTHRHREGGGVGQCREPVHQLFLWPQKQQYGAKLITNTFRHSSSWLATNPHTPPCHRQSPCFDVSCWGGSLNIRTYLCSTAVISLDFLVWSWCFASICLWMQNMPPKICGGARTILLCIFCLLKLKRSKTGSSMALQWVCLPIISLHQSCWKTEEVKQCLRAMLQQPLNTHLFQNLPDINVFKPIRRGW